MNPLLSAALTGIFLLGIGYVLLGGGTDETNITSTQSNIEVQQDVQQIILSAKGGYRPHVTIAHSNIPTELHVQTNSTFDCSSSLVIPALGYKSILPSSGDTIIQIPPQSSGTVLKGKCGMGMYGFELRFIL